MIVRAFVIILKTTAPACGRHQKSNPRLILSNVIRLGCTVGPFSSFERLYDFTSNPKKGERMVQLRPFCVHSKCFLNCLLCGWAKIVAARGMTRRSPGSSCFFTRANYSTFEALCTTRELAERTTLRKLRSEIHAQDSTFSYIKGTVITTKCGGDPGISDTSIYGIIAISKIPS